MTLFQTNYFLLGLIHNLSLEKLLCFKNSTDNLYTYKTKMRPFILPYKNESKSSFSYLRKHDLDALFRNKTVHMKIIYGSKLTI